MIYTLVRKKNGNVDAIISFDSVNSSEETWSASVTTQTVEKGFNISDNINIEPPTYNISAVISSYSLFNKDNEIVWDGSSFKSNDNYYVDSHLVARENIIKIFKERSILTLVESSSNSNNEDKQTFYAELLTGRYRETDNCVITALSISNPDNSTGSFYINLTLQKIHVAVVSVENLTAEEAIPVVRPLLVDVKTKESSQVKTEDSLDAGMDVNIIEQEAPDLSLSTEAGKTQKDFDLFRAKKLAAQEYKNQAVRDVRALVAADGLPRTMVQQGDSWGWKYLR